MSDGAATDRSGRSHLVGVACDTCGHRFLLATHLVASRAEADEPTDCRRCR